MMKTLLGLAVSAAVLAACAHSTQAPAAATTAPAPVAATVPTTPVTGTTMSGVFSVAQAARGEALYHSTCERCHGADLKGGADGAPLVGADFAGDMNGMTVAQMHGQIQATMPSDHPKTLSNQAVSDLIAFILSKNGMPAGPAELPADPALLKGVQFATAK